ncbi:hypothetical protein HPB48_023300 [Haemaphysalis longicornis]|uniref:Uncharacterized protein n=1 Tax=Haemaphysalis longicornis TaxID=44386 RepID=A0A9J6H783_HAELO|nr:hypothetical protein HPB48_023300 [Haemaphysalis longicornis]
MGGVTEVDYVQNVGSRHGSTTTVMLSNQGILFLEQGDVELNPGPDVKAILKELCDVQKVIGEDLNDLGKRMGQLEKALQIVKDQADALAKLTKTVKDLTRPF